MNHYGHEPAEIPNRAEMLAVGAAAERNLSEERIIGAICLALIIGFVGATAASSATITEAQASGAGWRSIDTNPADFIRTGRCGSGGAVVGDGCAPIAADDLAPLIRYGQNAPGGVNSQDTRGVLWTITAPQAFKAVSFDLQDFRDLKRSNGRITVSGDDFGTVRVGRGQNAETRSFVVQLGAAVRRVSLRIFTGRNDGFTVKNAKVCK